MRNLHYCRLLLLGVLLLDMAAIAQALADDSDLAVRLFLIGVALSWLGASFGLRFWKVHVGQSARPGWAARFLDIQLGAGVLLLGLVVAMFVDVSLLYILYVLVYLGLTPLVIPMLVLYLLLWLMVMQLARLLPFIGLSLVLGPVLMLRAARNLEWRAVRNGALALIVTLAGLRLLSILFGEEGATQLYLLMESSLRYWPGYPFGIMAGTVVFSTFPAAMRR
jgi:hypothetical protein